MKDVFQAMELAIRRQSADASKELLNVGLLLGGKGLARQLFDLIGIRDVIQGFIVRCVFIQTHQSHPVGSGNGIEMVLKRLVQGR